MPDRKLCRVIVLEDGLSWHTTAEAAKAIEEKTSAVAAKGPARAR